MPGPDRRRLRSHRCGSAAPARTPCAGRVTKPWQVSWLAGHRRSFAFPVHLDARTSGVPKDGSPLTVAGAAAESAQEPHRVPFSSGHESSPAARNQSALTVAEEIARVNPPRTSQGRILPRHCASRFPNGGCDNDNPVRGQSGPRQQSFKNYLAVQSGKWLGSSASRGYVFQRPRRGLLTIAPHACRAHHSCLGEYSLLPPEFPCIAVGHLVPRRRCECAILSRLHWPSRS